MSDMHSMVGSYVADALDDGEREEFDQHLASCAACRAEVYSLREALVEVGAFHEAAPPPMLRASILGAISGISQLPAQEPRPARSETAQPSPAVQHPSAVQPPPESPAPSNVIAPAHGFGRPRRPVSTWLAAAAAVLAVALGGVTVWQQSELRSVQAADAQRADLLAAPDLVVAPGTLDGGRLTYLVSKERGEALVTSSDLPDPGPERSWQVWVMKDGVPRSGALLDSGGRVQAWIDGVSGGQALAITNEPRGGSPAPTTDEIQAIIEF
ncbi:anti-sigma factor [Tessaracoccus antarcticus]|uniref:Regulator of SigK n=1 Tax=Tessaracoccus antarcticus TaxID=2479848 RepID=A0A3M0GAZ0_9ACTN|nr:anti-sigma factor [Tessaracoccus antarcticus]RMB62084.1 hypothetical protein EAX62_05770 [Tessaracoccus antarcticus]